ncbi:hypothetical protein Lal_00047512 [Lupinus albus]|nr:hypothetical protein Lal_00047512 [Lupinus albus]
MVERWRSETHTFHFPNGECTITLEDVAYQLGLPIEGKAIIGDTSMDWGDLCLQLLGVAPTERQIMGQRVQHTWLESIYQQLPEDADEEVVEQHARAFILRMLGGFLMPDTSGSRVHLIYLPLLDDLFETFDYSWGSAVLAYLYRGLCRAAVFKDQKEFVWTPYRNMNVMGNIPNICRARVPLICFATVECHAADWVMRQFGLQQTIPEDPPNFDKLHKIDLRGKIECNWSEKHKVWIQMWETREQCVATVFLTLKLCITTQSICSGIYKGQGDSSSQTGHILLEQ